MSETTDRAAPEAARRPREVVHEAAGRERERGSIPEWVMLLVMGIGIIMAVWAVVQPDIVGIVSDALGKLRG